MKINSLINRNTLYVIASVSVVTLLGFYLRYIGIEKENGMWHDEIVTYKTAANESIIKVIKSSIPRPFYFVLLHFWIEWFGNSDLTMRLLSLVFGTLAVPAMYFAGAELQKTYDPEVSQKVSSLGITTSLLTAINSFLIYYSQEIRQYALLTLVCALSAYVLLRLINKPDKKNLILFITINFIFVLTHYISTIFLFFELVFLIVYFRLKNEIQYDKRFNKYIIIMALAGLPFFLVLLKLFISVSFQSKKVLINTFDPYYFDYQTIVMIFQNWFTPILTGIYNNAPFYFSELLNNLRPGIFIFIILPLILSFLSILNAVFPGDKKLKPVHILFLTPFLFLMVDYILSLTKTYIIISRYTLFCLPYVLLVLGYGILKFKNKIIKLLIIFLLTAISLLFILLNPDSAPKKERPEGQKVIQRLLDGVNVSLQNKDIIIFPIDKAFSEEHVKVKPRVCNMRNTFLDDETVYRLIGVEQAKNIGKINSRKLFLNYFRADFYTPPLEDYFNREIYKNLEPGRFFILAHNLQLAYFSPYDIKVYIRNEKLYNKLSLKFMLYSKISADLYKLANEKMELVETRKSFPWVISIFKKVEAQ